jgi:2-polyprenyl-3-methyl-5-hydroxy-6-metoxy-1,4-benzoquinol methylase
MPTISEDYREMNYQMHLKKRNYGAWGYRWAETVRRMWGREPLDILDYGSGKGSLGRALGYPIAEYDPAIPKKAAEPGVHDYLVCSDVLEHIEPECIDDVLAHMASKMKLEGLLVVATRPAKKILEDGRNAHLIVQPVEWWTEKIQQHFSIKSIEDKPPILPGSTAEHTRFRRPADIKRAETWERSSEYVLWVKEIENG